MASKELHKKVEDDYKKFPPLFKEFCDFVIYIKDKTSEQVVEEITNLIKFKKRNMFLTRHGESLANSKRISQGNRDEWEDTSLTKRGKEQAKKVAGRLKKEDIDLIYSSDLKEDIL